MGAAWTSIVLSWVDILEDNAALMAWTEQDVADLQ